MFSNLSNHTRVFGDPTRDHWVFGPDTQYPEGDYRTKDGHVYPALYTIQELINRKVTETTMDPDLRMDVGL